MVPDSARIASQTWTSRWQRGPPVGRAAPDGAVLVPQVVDRRAHVVGDALGRRAELVHQRPERLHLRADGGEVALDLDELGHRHARDRLALAVLPVADDAVRVGHRVRGVVQQRDGDDVLAGAEVAGGELAELRAIVCEGVPVGAGLPRRGDRRVERVHERVHVRGVEVVLLVPGRGRQHDVGEDRRARLPEVEGEQQVELPLGGLVVPVDVAAAAGPRGASVARSEESVPEQVLEEVLVALARGAEQVRPPDRQHPREVLRRVRVLGGEAAGRPDFSWSTT